MKKKATPLSKQYYPLILWADDLNDIWNILNARTKSIKIESEENIFDTIEEYIRHFSPRPQTYLQITSADPYVSIDLTNMAARLYADENAKDSSGIFYEIDRILRSAQRRFYFGYSFIFTSFLIGLIWVSNLFPPIRFASHQFDIRLVIVPLTFIWVSWVSFIQLKRFSKIRLERRASAISFLQRNSDQLVVGVIAAVIGALAGIVGTLLLAH
jgi:hypothetical protein